MRLTSEAYDLVRPVHDRAPLILDPRHYGLWIARKPKEAAQSLVARLQAKSEAHARSVLQQMARLLGMKVVEKEEGK